MSNNEDTGRQVIPHRSGGGSSDYRDQSAPASGSAMQVAMQAAGKSAPTVVLYDSDEAASLRTFVDITGYDIGASIDSLDLEWLENAPRRELWLSRDGRVYEEENVARYVGCTHRKCRSCEAIVERGSLVCDTCVEKERAQRWRDAVRRPVEWDSVLYSEALDQFFFSAVDCLDVMRADGGSTEESLRLYHCEPNLASELDTDQWVDELPEDGDMPDRINDAINAFNEAVKGTVLSWSPTKVAAVFPENCLAKPPILRDER